jgi:hypothetical protein
MDPGFGGEIPDLYHQYRRGYAPAVIDEVAGTFGLTGAGVVVDWAGALRAPDARPAFAEQVRRAVAPHLPLTEHVRVAMLLGPDRRRGDAHHRGLDRAGPADR